MSKSNNGDQPKDQADTASGLLTVEEHARKLNIDAPIFAAVMETKKWGGGKKVTETDFKTAVKMFVGGSMDGTPDPGKDNSKPLTVEEHSRNLKIDAPVFAAVLKGRQWAGGEKVTEADFKAAVKEFVDGSKGGS